MPKHAPVSDAVSNAAYLMPHALPLSPAVADCSWSVRFSLCCPSVSQPHRGGEKEREGSKGSDL